MATSIRRSHTADMETPDIIRRKVFIAEDSASVRSRLVKMLQQIDGMEVSGEAENPNSAIEGILATKPDFVVLDYQLLGGTGVEVLQGTSAQLPATVFIVLSNHTNPQYRRLCMGAGAKYYFDKSVEFAKVKEVILASETSH